MQKLEKEKLTILDEVKLIVILENIIEQKESYMKRSIVFDQTCYGFLKEMYANDIQELKIILNKLK